MPPTPERDHGTDHPPVPPLGTDHDLALLQARLDRLVGRRSPDDPAAPNTVAERRAARPHPARRARIVAFGLTVASTSGLTALLLRTTTSTQVAPASVVAAPAVPDSRPEPTGTPAWDSRKGPAPTPAADRAVVDGAVFQNRWGNVQVRATFDTSGALVAVEAIQVPNDSPPSAFINQNAVPALDAEALQLQSARVHTVTGATDTSTSYQQSLQAAIDAARAAQLTTLA